MDIKSCNTDDDNKCPLHLGTVLTDENVILFDKLLEGKCYQEIEDMFRGKDSPISSNYNNFIHWVFHKSLEYIKQIFKDRIEEEIVNSVTIIKLVCSDDEMLEGFLIYALRHAALMRYKTNLDEKDLVKRREERARKAFDPETYHNAIAYKRIHIAENKLPAFNVTLQNLKDFESQTELNEKWHKTKEWYLYFEEKSLLSVNELRKEFDSFSEDSIFKFAIKFLTAKIYQVNLDRDDCVKILKKIAKHYKSNDVSQYYGLHIVCKDEDLAYLIHALLQIEFKFPLVVHDVSNQDHIDINKISEVRSGWYLGNCTHLGGCYDTSRDFMLAFKIYDWIESEEIYLTSWLIFRDFSSGNAKNPVSVGITWSCVPCF